MIQWANLGDHVVKLDIPSSGRSSLSPHLTPPQFNFLKPKNLENKSQGLWRWFLAKNWNLKHNQKMQFSETCSIQRLIFPFQWYNYVSRCIVMQKKFKKTQKLNFKCYGFENKILKKSSWNLPILRRRFDPFILLKDASNPARWLWN